MIDRLSGREKILAGCVMAAFLLFVYYSFFLSPILNQIKSTRLYIKEHNVVHKIEQTKDNRFEIPSDIKLSAAEIPNMERNSDIAYNIKIIADKSMVELNKLSFGDITPLEDSKYNYIKSGGNSLLTSPITVDVTGDDKRLVSFIKELENDKRICEVMDINMLQNSNSLAEAKLSLRYFYFNGGE